MMIQTHIEDIIRQALKKAQKKGDLPRFDTPAITVTRPRREGQGDYSTALPLQIVKPVNNALKALGASKRSPMQIGEILIKRLPQADFLDRAELAKPGFINFHLSPVWLAQQAGAIVQQGPEYYKVDLGGGKRAQVEFVSANPTGPLHFGGARNAAIGDTLARLLEHSGYQVQREYYVNDRGTQMVTFAMTLWRRYQQLFGMDVEIPPNGYPGAYMMDYAEKIKAEYGDHLLSLPEEEIPIRFRELGLKIVLDELKNDLALMDVHFDEWFSEQSLYDEGVFARVFAILSEQGDLYEKDGAVWFKASKYIGGDRDEVFIRSNGEPGYFASDLAYHYHKFILRDFDWVIDVWAVDHQNQAKRLPPSMKAFGVDPERLTIVLYDLVTLKRGGKEVKISKRSGEIITMREVLEEVGADAARYFLLSHSNEARIDFDIDLAVAQSSENPVYYIQYAHARASSILRKAAAAGFAPSDAHLDLLTCPEELALVRKMLQLSEVVLFAIERLSPHHLPHYALDLAKTYTNFYGHCRVISDDPAQKDLTEARLMLVRAAQVTLAYVLGLMGMTAPETM
ncbi:MAG TPA: arginine--tRNA ligase [Anaerolineae bacterium]|nr:arginine--tRNA ligase [Anaerolineae bacterium]